MDMAEKLLQGEIWWPLISYLFLLVANFALGTLKALRDGEFRWDRLMGWVTDAAIIGAGLAILAVLSAFYPAVWAAYAPALATAIATETRQAIQKIAAFTGSQAE